MPSPVRFKTSKQRKICNLQILKWSKMPDWTRKTTTRTQLVYGRIEPATPAIGSQASDLCRLLGSQPSRLDNALLSPLLFCNQKEYTVAIS